MINENLELLIFAETEVSEGNEPEPTDAHGIDLQFDSLSDSEYGCADLLNEYADKLESDTEFTQEEIDEMVEMFNEFNGVIEEFLAEYEG